MPGRPKDIVGLKAMAIFHQRMYAALPPGRREGACAARPSSNGAWWRRISPTSPRPASSCSGEIGLGGVKDGVDGTQDGRIGRGNTASRRTIHTGGPSIPGSGLIDKDVVLEVDADVVGHINGGHTALPDSQIRCICEGCKRGLEIVHNGNERAALYTLRTAQGTGPAGPRHPRHRCARPAPACSRSASCAWSRCSRRWAISRPRSPSALPPATPRACAKLDAGLIRSRHVGRFRLHGQGAAFRRARTCSESVQLGDLPGVGMVVIDGIARIQRSRNTPPATRIPDLVKGSWGNKGWTTCARGTADEQLLCLPQRLPCVGSASLLGRQRWISGVADI